MRTNCRVPIFFSLLILLSVSDGLFSSSVPAAPPKAGAKNAASGLSGISTDATATFPDPKRPGKLLYELRYKVGNAQLNPSGASGTLTTVWARLYQNGAPSVILTAPHARLSSVGKVVTVTGTGGIVMKSLTEPGTKMTADTVVWYAGQNTIVATGHVFYRNGKNGMTATGSRMVSHTGLKTMEVDAGQGTMRL